MTDEFQQHYGQLDVGPRHPRDPRDPALSLYSVHDRSRKFDVQGDKMIDVKTGEVVGRATADGRIALPGGRTIPAPKLVARVPAVDPAQRLYGKRPAAQRSFGADLFAKPAPAAKSLADRLYAPAKPRR